MTAKQPPSVKISLLNEAGENAISPPALTLGTSSVGIKRSMAHGQSSPPAPAEHFAKHNLDIVGNTFVEPGRLPFTEPHLAVIISSSKALHYYSSPLSPSFQYRVSATPDEHGSSPHVGAPGEFDSFQSSDQLDDGNAAMRERRGIGSGPITTYCATTASPESKCLHFHVNPDGKMYRWGAGDGRIPISINLESFKSDQHGSQQGPMVQKCLETVVHKLNHINIGPQFEFVQTPSESAFFVTHGVGRTDNYASAFFPGSDPKDWYIYVYDLGLELDELQLIKVLTHEMMHVVGLRHCYVDPEKESEPYMRYPRGISDHEHWDILMESHLTLNDLSMNDLKPRTVEDLRTIYALQTGEAVDGYQIQDVSWKVGAAHRKAMAWNNACICIPRL